MKLTRHAGLDEQAGRALDDAQLGEVRRKETARDHDKLDVRYLQMRIAEEPR